MLLRTLLNASKRLTTIRSGTACMAYDSSNKVHNKIHNLITKSDKKMFVFMKGTPKEPACRYSGVVVQILDAYGFEYDSFNVLEDDHVRQELKSFSDWPTIPQVFKDGSFIGGCDIMLQMHQNGDLNSLANAATK